MPARRDDSEATASGSADGATRGEPTADNAAESTTAGPASMADDATQLGETQTVETRAVETRAEEKAEPTETDSATDGPTAPSLPAFGFAEDLLREHRAQVNAAAERADAEDAPTVEDLEAERDREAEIEREMLAAVTVDLDETAPGRIFQFADRLAAVDRAEEAEAVRRLETWVTFSLADEIFALPVEPIQQVVRPSDITRVPHAPRPIRGVTNLRGRVIPVIDLRLRIGLEETVIERTTRVVAVGSRGRLLGLLVDAVHQVVKIDVDLVQPPPEDVLSVQADYILGVYPQDDRLMLLLDVDRALIVRQPGAA